MSISKLAPSFQDDDWNALRQFLKTLTLKSTDSTIHRVMKHMLVNTSDATAIANTTTRTVFDVSKTLSVALFRPGRIVKVLATGVYSTTGTPNLTIDIGLGTNVITSSGVQATETGASGAAWRAQGEIVCKSVTSSGPNIFNTGVHDRRMSATTSLRILSSDAAGTTTNIGTAALSLQVYITWGTASASNTATLTNLIVMLSDY